MLCTAMVAGAHEPEFRSTGSYINLSGLTQKIKPVGRLDRTMKSSRGGALEFGNTYYIRPYKPFEVAPLGKVRLGVDFSFLDLQGVEYEQAGGTKTYFGNIGMQVGPSVTVIPVKDVSVKLYLHYAPSLAGIVVDDANEGVNEVMLGYAGYVTGGLRASWKFLSLGVELRGATANLTAIDEDDIELDSVVNPGLIDIHDPMGSLEALQPEWSVNTDRRVKVKLPGVRFSLGFQF